MFANMVEKSMKNWPQTVENRQTKKQSVKILRQETQVIGQWYQCLVSVDGVSLEIDVEVG